jgi:hypothetical protein
MVSEELTVIVGREFSKALQAAEYLERLNRLSREIA